MLTTAYIYRKEWEAKLFATQVVNMLGQALGGKKGRNKQGTSGPPKPISATQMFREAGKQV